MTASRNPDSIIGAWLEEGPNTLPESTRRAIAVASRTNRQARRRVWLPWRIPNMNGWTKFAVAGVAVVAITVGGLYVLNRAPGGPGAANGPTPSPSPAVTPTPSPSVAPSSSVTDVATWVTYHSDRYGFDIGHPADWVPHPADHKWTMAEADDWLSNAQEWFTDPTGTIRVGAWQAALESGASVETQAEIVAWAEAYCRALNPAPKDTTCDGIADRAVNMCVEKRDCHPAILVHFEDDIQAFIPFEPDVMTVVALWRPQDFSGLGPYGGGQKLLESFLETMNVWPDPNG